MESGKVVLVTAAAGGTGQFAVQVYICCMWQQVSVTVICYLLPVTLVTYMIILCKTVYAYKFPEQRTVT